MKLNASFTAKCVNVPIISFSVSKNHDIWVRVLFFKGYGLVPYMRCLHIFFLLSSSVLGKTWVLVRFALAAWVWVLSHLYLKLIMLISLYNHV